MHPIIKYLDKVDYKITKTIFDLVNTNKFISSIPYLIGLIPYEIYVLPGMFIAIITMVINNSYHPVQFHLLPHWFAFSLASYIKHNIHRDRPGCVYEDMGYKISENHCKGSTQRESFPSGHTIIAAALATSLIMYLNDDTYPDEDKVFLTIPFYNPIIKKIVTGTAITVVIMIALHRIGFGYHHFGDVVVGGILGAIIGYVSYSSFNLARKHCVSQKDESKEPMVSPWINRIIQIVLIFISGISIYDFFKNKFVKLAELKH